MLEDMGYTVNYAMADPYTLPQQGLERMDVVTEIHEHREPAVAPAVLPESAFV